MHQIDTSIFVFANLRLLHTMRSGRRRGRRRHVVAQPRIGEDWSERPSWTWGGAPRRRYLRASGQRIVVTWLWHSWHDLPDNPPGQHRCAEPHAGEDVVEGYAKHLSQAMLVELRQQI